MADHPGRPPFAARDRRPGRVRGGMTAIGIRLAVAEPRISAAVLFAGSFVPRSPGRGGPAGHHSAAVPAAVGRRRERPAAGPGPVRRLRHQGEDAARQSGRARWRPVVRGGRRGPVLRPAPEVRPGRQAAADGRRCRPGCRSSRTGPGPPRSRWPADAQPPRSRRYRPSAVPAGRGGPRPPAPPSAGRPALRPL